MLKRWLALAAGVIVFDQLTKLAVLRTFSLGERVEITSFFNLVLVYNQGAAFSFLSDAGGWQKWFFVALALAVSAWIVVMLHRESGKRLQSFALALILGGALGNVIDRLLYGAVVDFLDFYWGTAHWPAFNVADSAISVGAAVLIIEQLFAGKETPGQTKDAA